MQGLFSCPKTTVAMIHSNPEATPADPPPNGNGLLSHPSPFTGGFFQQDTALLATCARSLDRDAPAPTHQAPPVFLGDFQAYCEEVLGFPIRLNTALLLASDKAANSAQARVRYAELLASQTKYEKRLGFQLSPQTVRKIQRQDTAIYPSLYGKSKSNP